MTIAIVCSNARCLNIELCAVCARALTFVMVNDLCWYAWLKCWLFYMYTFSIENIRKHTHTPTKCRVAFFGKNTATIKRILSHCEPNESMIRKKCVFSVSVGATISLFECVYVTRVRARLSSSSFIESRYVVTPSKSSDFLQIDFARRWIRR